MSKFKVGDVVRVVGRSGIFHMFTDNTVGKVIDAGALPLIKNLSRNGVLGGCVQYVSECDLELVEKSKAHPDKSLWKVVISSTGDETTARFYVDGKCPITATVRRYYKDKYDTFIAADEAVKKLFGKQNKPIEHTEPEKPKGFTGKAMYISDSEYNHFIKGRIYDFVDGIVVDDDGVKRPSPLNKEWSVQEKERWLNQFFIKVVE
ncbi:MAG: hypothetical protein ACI3XQ_06510 [Eubacteriales bacterium]